MPLTSSQRSQSSSPARRIATVTDESIPTLRELFPSKENVLIYPDDFQNAINDDHGNNENAEDRMKNIILSEMVDRKTGHFSDRRVAVMFRPSNTSYHNINFPVGYWTQAIGLGEVPSDVTFTGFLGIYAIPANTENHAVGSLDTFWRSAENFVSDTSFVRKNDNSEVWGVPVGSDSSIDLSPISYNDKTNEPQFKNVYPLPQDIGTTEKKAYDVKKGMIWAVSQAAPIRRVQVTNNLHLSLGDNYASGGFLSNVDVGGYLFFGAQQQYYVRNCHVQQKAVGGAWNFVFNGCSYQQEHRDNENRGGLEWVYRNEDALYIDQPVTEVQIEKPYIFINHREDNHVYLAIPRVKYNTTGVDYGYNDGNEKIGEGDHIEEKILIDNNRYVKVFSPNDDFPIIQESVDNGIHVVLSPGIYRWNQTLVLSKSSTVILGLGLSTIQAPTNGKPCIYVKDNLSGIRISGISLEANVIADNYNGSSLLQWGGPLELEGLKESNSTTDNNRNHNGSDKNNPNAIHDLYCFVGGRNTNRNVSVEVMVKLYSNNIVGDNVWLWRADHVKLTPNEKPNRPESSNDYHETIYGECKCDNGLQVYGNDIIFHGLAIEHTYKDLLSWYGQNGKVHFYQSELPYDVPSTNYHPENPENDKSMTIIISNNNANDDDDDNDDKYYCGYHVHENAINHYAEGIGVYSNFRDFDNVYLKSAIRHHNKASNGVYNNSFTIWLDGHGYNALQSVINGYGPPTTEQGIPFPVSSYFINAMNSGSDDGISSSGIESGSGSVTSGSIGLYLPIMLLVIIMFFCSCLFRISWKKSCYFLMLPSGDLSNDKSKGAKYINSAGAIHDEGDVELEKFRDE